MRIFMVSKGHVERMHTLKVLFTEKLSATIVTHTEEDKARIEEHVSTSFYNGRTYFKVIATGNRTLEQNRNTILEMLAEGEWFIGLDDNIQAFTSVPENAREHAALPVTSAPPPRFATWRQFYRRPAELRQHAHRLRDEMEKHETFYGGFASMENPFFRAKQWSFHRFVKSKAFVMQKRRNVYWKTEYLHDSHMSALTVALVGRVVVDNWTHPVHRMYEIGGLGGDRQAKLEPELPLVLNEFNGLVARATGKNSALRFVRTQQPSVDEWRARHGYLLI